MIFRSVDLHSVLVFTAFAHWAKLNRDRHAKCRSGCSIVFRSPFTLVVGFFAFDPRPSYPINEVLGYIFFVSVLFLPCSLDSSCCSTLGHKIFLLVQFNVPQSLRLFQDRALDPSSRFSSTATLTVRVRDSDDQGPKFARDVYEAKVGSNLCFKS